MSIYFDDGIKYQFSMLEMTEFSSFRRNRKNGTKWMERHSMFYYVRLKAKMEKMLLCTPEAIHIRTSDITSNICVTVHKYS